MQPLGQLAPYSDPAELQAYEVAVIREKLLQQLTKRVLESALEGKSPTTSDNEKHDPAGAGSSNSRNWAPFQDVLTDVGPVQLTVPRDRDGSFEPQIVKERKRRLAGVDEMGCAGVERGSARHLRGHRSLPGRGRHAQAQEPTGVRCTPQSVACACTRCRPRPLSASCPAGS